MKAAMIAAVLLTIAGAASLSAYAQPTANGTAASGPAGAGAGGGVPITPPAGGAVGTPVSPPSGAGTPSAAQANTGPGNTAKQTRHSHHRKTTDAPTPSAGDSNSTGATQQ